MVTLRFSVKVTLAPTLQSRSACPTCQLYGRNSYTNMEILLMVSQGELRNNIVILDSLGVWLCLRRCDNVASSAALRYSSALDISVFQIEFFRTPVENSGFVDSPTTPSRTISPSVYLCLVLVFCLQWTSKEL